MAENKKSFVLYSDSQGLVNQLPDDVAGRLLKHIYAYVNDENPISDELLLNIAFEPIKMQLKRDLQKWETQIEQRRQAGLKSAEVRKRNATSVNERSISSTDNVNVNDNVSVNVNDNDILLKKETKEGFSEIEILPLNNKEQKRKKVAQKKENETIDATDDFLLLWNEYKSYRVAKKKTFKFANLRFEQMAFDKLYKLSNQNFETAKKIVTQTIENNWEGLFELKENKVVEPIVAGRQTLSTIQSNSDWSMIENPYAKK